MPDGADAVVQIENTEALQPAANGNRRVKIKQVGMSSNMTKNFSLVENIPGEVAS